MGRFIIKPEADRDLYIEWSTVVDAPVKAGTRETITAELDHEFGTHGRDHTREALDRADELGSSSMLGDGAWNDERLILMNGPGAPGLIYRKDLVKMIEVYEKPDAEKLIGAMVEPFEDDG